MPVEIRETIVIPTANGSAVQLHISDAPPGDVSAETVLRLTVQIPKAATAVTLERMQHQALKIATGCLGDLMPELARKAQEVE